GRARTIENISRRIGGSECFAEQVTGEHRLGQCLIQCLQIRPIAYKIESNRQSFGAQLPVSFRQNIQIFLLRDTTDIKQMNNAIVFAEFLPKSRIAVFGTAECSIEPAWENFQFFRCRSPRIPASAMFIRIHEHTVELAIERLDVTPD